MNTTCEIKNESMHGQKKDTIKRFYVYRLIDPSDNLPFYVGKGTGNRMYHHENSVLNGKIPNGNRFLFYKIKKVIKEFSNIHYLKIKSELNEDDALKLEISEIKKFGRRDIKTGILCNMTDGGESFSGFKQKKEHINKRILAWKLWNGSLSPEKKMSIREKGAKNSKLFWDNNPERKDEQILHLKNYCWKYGKDSHFYGKDVTGKKNPNYKPIDIDIENRILELYRLKIGKRTITKKILKEFGKHIECNRVVNCIRLNGIKTRSVDDANENKRLVVPPPIQSEIIDLFCNRKFGVVNITKLIFEKYRTTYSHGVIRRFLQRKGIYVTGQKSRRIFSI